MLNIFDYLQDSWDADDEETKKPEIKVPEKKTKSKLEQKIAEREVHIKYITILCLMGKDFHFVLNVCINVQFNLMLSTKVLPSYLMAVDDL